MNKLSNCDCCPRLRKFILENRKKYPDFFNDPVPSFGDKDSQLLIVGLAPGLKGANRTGRPFTGDYAGDLLYATLKKFGYTRGTYDTNNNDDLTLVNCLITNAVKCVPPQNKPTTEETRTCLNQHFTSELKEYKNVKIFLALGSIAHTTLLKFFDLKPLSQYKFAHGAIHNLANGITIIDSYHCSRYNTNTNRLTPQMFDQIFHTISTIL